MTIKNFYSKKHALKAPEGLNFLEKRAWFLEKIKELEAELSADDLELIKRRKIAWKNKLQSSHV